MIKILNLKLVILLKYPNTEPKSFGRKVKVELDLSNYTRKSDLKNATCADTSKFSKKFD